LTPGPGTYDLADLVGRNSPAVVIKGRLNNSLIPENPGPGSYNPQQSIAKSTTPTYKMPLSKREFLSMKGSFLPGPGQYEPKFMNTSIGFSIKGKTE
jgi:Sperm-tail PG-rich repeat